MLTDIAQAAPTWPAKTALPRWQMTPRDLAELSAARTRPAELLPAPAPTAPVSLERRIKTLVSGHGGKLRSTQRQIADALGTNVSAVNRCLNAMAKAKVVTLRSGRTGTQITLRASGR